MNKILLASASPRRKELLGRLGFPFQIKISDADETISQKIPSLVVEELSGRKAMAVADTEPDALVIGADTVVASENTILGKPKDKEDAIAMLRSLQGKIHQVYTGVTVIWTEHGEKKKLSFSEKTEVCFYPMTEEEITAYVETGDPMDKAGGYGIQGLFSIYVKEIRGDYNNVVGLPAARLYQELKRNGLLSKLHKNLSE